MSALREYLKRTLKKKVDTYGIVVWVDDHREYGVEVAREVCPPETHFVAWDGSWFALKREIEPLVADVNPPRLLIYQPVKTPREDPLAEVRDAGTEWKIRLSTLLRNALGEELSAQRLEEISRQSRTLEEAEVALRAGEILEVRLQTVLEATDPVELALRILADPSNEILEREGLWEDARRFLRRAFGGEPQGNADALRNSVFRHLVLLELEETLGSLPESLRPVFRPADREQRRRSRELLARWRRDLDRVQTYRKLAVQAEADLKLEEVLVWDERLKELDTVPVLEKLAFGRAVELLQEKNFAGAAEMAKTRKRSMWIRASVPEAMDWQPRWRAVEALAHLHLALLETPVPRRVSAEELLHWYEEKGWRVDRAHRHCEAALTELVRYGPLEKAITRARRAYHEWLEGLLNQFTETVEREGMEIDLHRQSDIHKAHVASREGVTAYFWVDALRYELGRELADALQHEGHPEVEIFAAVATPPTLTPVGMASLLPRAERGLRLSLSSSGEIEVFVDEIPVHTVQDRINMVRAVHGEVVEFTLTDLCEQGERKLRELIGSAQLVIVRSQEIDEIFESDHIAAAWKYVNEIRDLLIRAMERLSAAGVQRFVIASDHGFIILSQSLGPERAIEPPGGQGKLHRRCWVGKGGATPVSTVRIPLADFGVAGDLDLVVPRGLAIFGVAGARRFLHGGLSPQELLVPVVVVRTRLEPPLGGGKVVARVIGDRITTGVFSVSLTLEADLFTMERRVRISARNRRGEEVARIVAGEGFDEETGVVLLRAGVSQVLTLRVTSSLARKDIVTLYVYETGTDRLLGTSRPAEVVSDVEVD